MIKLVQNELIKINERKSTHVYTCLIFLFALIGGIVYSQMNETKTNWEYMNDLAIAAGVFITLFAVIIASSTIAAEFSDGTIKQLMIRPYSRQSILVSKFIAIILYSLLWIAIYILSTLITGWIFFGIGSFSAEIVEGSKIVQVGPQFFLKMLYLVPGLVLFVTIAFMLSTLLKNQAIAVGFSIFALFSSATAGALIGLVVDKFSWMKYLPFPHLDLTVFTRQEAILDTITLPISLGILSVYFVLFMLVSFGTFTRRDINV